MAVGQAYYVVGGSETKAAAGTTGANATAIGLSLTTITGADGTKGVRLPIAYGGSADECPPGRGIAVYNSDVTNTLKVYPPTGGTIDGGSVDASVSVVALATAYFTPSAGLTYSSVLNALTSTQSGYLTGITPGTVTASKAVVVDGTKNIATFGTVGAGAVTITDASAASLSVGRLGATTPALAIDDSTATCITGVLIKAAATGNGVALTSTGGANELITVDTKGSGTLGLNTVNNSAGLTTIGNATNLGGVAINGPATHTSASATALTVGRLGATTPALLVDASTGTSITGLKIKSAATGNGVALSAVGAAAEPITIDAATTGIISIGTTSTGQVVMGRGSRLETIYGLTKTPVAAQNTTPTAAQLLGGYYAHTSQTGGGTATLPLASLLDAAITGVATGDSFVCLYTNPGNQTVTVTTNTGFTVSGTVAIPTLRSANLFFYRTGAGAWDCVVTLNS